MVTSDLLYRPAPAALRRTKGSSTSFPHYGYQTSCTSPLPVHALSIDSSIYIELPHQSMKRLEPNDKWSLFNPADVPDLIGTYGDEFDAAYAEYEYTITPVSTIRARDLWSSIAHAQRESGTPFMLYQDSINRTSRSPAPFPDSTVNIFPGKNNQSHLGVIRSSNLCTEIVQFSSPSETAVCTLASLSLPNFVRADSTFDFDLFVDVVKLATDNTDRLIDASTFLTPASARSAQRTRAIGLGVQGLADLFMRLSLPFDSPQARRLNVLIFETLYYASLDASCSKAQSLGPYPAYVNSPASKGLLQVDLWAHVVSDRHDFPSLRSRISQYGLRNSMLTAQMPTASTSRLLANFESTEPYTRFAASPTLCYTLLFMVSPSNVLTYKILSGDYTEICPWLVRDLIARELWTDDMASRIISHHGASVRTVTLVSLEKICTGSLDAIDSIPSDIREIYRTVWQIDPTTLIDMAADRAPYIDQSQSMSLFVKNPTPDLLVGVYLLPVPTAYESVHHFVPVRSSASRVAPGTQDWHVLSAQPSCDVPSTLWCRIRRRLHRLPPSG